MLTASSCPLGHLLGLACVSTVAIPRGRSWDWGRLSKRIPGPGVRHGGLQAAGTQFCQKATGPVLSPLGSTSRQLGLKKNPNTWLHPLETQI